ncbi:spore coat protein GerQ [Paenibacillus agri]|uniref:Spore coat protein GerQ n=1 Tax=Paenibacillus agri TaxID=2744309 RepID=A0A850EGE7_9BACL|nr:spore coat protein GerQ [Paenibacillus agri]NUU59486.1 spore coat protein GerQ [Paenibacillus agri]
MIVQQPYRPVTYTIGSVSSGTMGTSNNMAPMGTMGTMGGTMQAVPPQVSSGSPMTPSGTVVSAPATVFEQSYIENILRLNLGKVGTFYMTYENNKDWNAKIFKGKLEAAGRDHIIISDPTTGQRIMLLMINFDYATFDEPLTYQYPGVIGNPGTRYYR